ncbi:hypothetical protein EON63_05490 [archaeon]|nr:MAG: hypothetical protein EON63_05490 [archaeon]
MYHAQSYTIYLPEHGVEQGVEDHVSIGCIRGGGHLQPQGLAGVVLLWMVGRGVRTRDDGRWYGMAWYGMV